MKIEDILLNIDAGTYESEDIYEKSKELYKLARSQARGIEEALDTILFELENPAQYKNDSLDDLPF